MAQPSVAAFFNTRKRAAVDQIHRSNKVLRLDEPTQAKVCDDPIDYLKRNRIATKLTFDSEMVSPKVRKPATRINRKVSTDAKQLNIQTLFQNMAEKKLEEVQEQDYPTTPKKQSMMDRINSVKKEDLSLEDIKGKLSRSTRLAELKASIARINKGAAKIDQLEKWSAAKAVPKQTPEAGVLKEFKTIELEIPVSPQKVPQSPLKAYLSPTKCASPRKNLFGETTPTKKTASPSKLAAYQRYAHLITEKPSLTLPHSYRALAEVFRCLDSVCAMFFNRNETITFKKVKPAVQELLRKNFTSKHLEQIQTIYPDAYTFHQEKIRSFGMKQEEYELVLTPKIQTDLPGERMGAGVLLERRDKLLKLLTEKVKDYHHEFLMNLEQPMNIPKDRLTRWHPEFDLEKVNEIESTPLPEPPNVEKLSTAKDVLSKAHDMFNCNPRMEKALQRLAEYKEKNDTPIIPIEPKESLLKGIPSSLLEKVRARQAAKALEVMTRAPEKDQEAQKYAQLPDLAKYTRNIFISERKGVLPLESVINKLNNSFRASFTASELEKLLRLLASLLPGWLVFHEIRQACFIKLAKETDMVKILNKLDKIAKDKANL